MRPLARRVAFTLIELLVVIAVIALLIGILLPALGRARLEAQKTISLSNLRQVGNAGMTYQHDNKSMLPVVPRGVPVAPTINSWITWGGWGKASNTGDTSSGFWITGGGGIFDIAPASRPLNPYLSQEYLPTKADITAGGTTATGMRKRFQIQVLRDPSDKIGHQQTWNAFAPSFGVANKNADGSSCYDDVGTSYLLQAKWFFQTTPLVGGSWTKAWHLGAKRMSLSEGFIPSRFIWVADEYCDITINQQTDTARIKNGYGDINRANVAFLDGHAKYQKMIPGGEGDPRRLTQPWLVPAYCNNEYTLVFPYLRAQ